MASLAGLALLAVAISVLLGWLLTTRAGRDVVLRQIVAHLPANTRLTWQQVDGPLSGPMTLHGVRLSMPRPRDPDCIATASARCAMGTLTFTAGTVMLDPDLAALLAGTVRLKQVQVTDATLDLPRSDAPFKLPSWPELLPQVAPPLTIRAAAIGIDALRIRHEGAPVIDIRHARGGLDVQRGRLHVEHLRVDSDRGRFTLHGDYAPGHRDHTELLATAVLPAPAGQPAARLGLVARGNLSRMVVALAGRAGEPLQAALIVQGNPDRPRWWLQARSDGLDPGLLTGGEPGVPWRFGFAATGTGGSAQWHGTLQRGAFTVRVLPSRLQVQDQRVQLQALALQTLDGRIEATGEVDLRDPAQAMLALTINARGLRWRDQTGTRAILADAGVALTGTVDRWMLTGQARLTRGKEHATVDLTGRGDRTGLRVEALSAVMPQGRLDATGTLAWTPALQWTAQAQLAGFDPGYFAPDWPGAIRGHLRSEGTLRDGQGLRAQIDAQELGGTLRDRALSGHAHGDIDGDRYAGELALTLGGSRIDARARIATTMAVAATLAPLRLEDLLPGAHGMLRGTLTLRGTRTAPDLAVDLTGSGLAFGDLRAAQVQAQGRLPWQHGEGRLRLDASAVQVGLALDAVHATLRGAVTRLQLDAEARGDFGALVLAGTAQAQGARWQGRLAQLQFTPAQAAAWTLQAPAEWRWNGGNGVLTPACLHATIGGVLCLSADWPRQGLTLQGQALPLALLAGWLPARAPNQPWGLDGQAGLEARLRPQGADWQLDAQLTSANGRLRSRPRAGSALLEYRDLVVTAALGPRQWQLSAYAALGDTGTLAARLDTGPQPQAPLQGALRLRTRQLRLLELLSPDLVAPQGQLDLALQLGGTRTQPTLAGTADLHGLNAELPALGIAIENGQLQLQADADGVAQIQGRLPTGKGELVVAGRLGWQDQSAPLQLTLRGTDVLLADTRQARILASPDIAVSYRAGSPVQVRGAVTVAQTDLHLERLEMAVSPSPDVVVLDPVDPDRARAPLGVDLDLTLTAGDAVRIDGYGLAGTVGGSLHVRQAPGQAMRATGALDLGGRYRAYGQDLRITRGRLLWSNTALDDPLLDLRAERTVGEVTAGIQVTGRVSSPRASVWSDPVMSPSEALAYLTLGRPLPDLSRSELQQVDAARTALNAGVGLLAAQLGARIGLDEAGVSTSRALGGEVLGVGKYLSPRLYVSYGVSLLGTGQVVMLKYLLKKGFDIQVESSTVENRASINWRKEK